MRWDEMKKGHKLSNGGTEEELELSMGVHCRLTNNILVFLIYANVTLISRKENEVFPIW